MRELFPTTTVHQRVQVLPYRDAVTRARPEASSAASGRDV